MCAIALLLGEEQNTMDITEVVKTECKLAERHYPHNLDDVCHDDEAIVCPYHDKCYSEPTLLRAATAWVER